MTDDAGRWPLGKRYDGGDHRIRRDDWLAYAAATDDANPAYRGDDGVAPPMFHVRPLIGLLLAMAGDPELGIDMLRLVHGSHGMAFHRPLRDGEELTLTGELARVDEKSAGTIYTFRLLGDVGDERVMEGQTAFFVRAKRDPSQEKDSKTKKEDPEPLPDPQWSTSQPVAEDQALRYAAASGDENPIHVDPEVAREAGLPGCILHGLCTMAFAQRDVIARYCGGDPARLAEISVRFAGMVLPGQTLQLKVWEQPEHLDFATFGPDGKPVITHGRAVVRAA